MAFTLAALVVQVIESAVTLVTSSAHAVPVGGVWVSGGSVLLLLAGAVVQRRAGWPQTRVQDLANQAALDKRMAEVDKGVGELPQPKLWASPPTP